MHGGIFAQFGPLAGLQGVSTTLVTALAGDAGPGGYYVDCRVEAAAVHPLAGDEDLARRLWERSEAAVAAAAAAAAAAGSAAAGA